MTLSQLARSRALDWAALRAEAERLGIARIVTVTFLLAQKLLGAELPEQIRHEQRREDAEGLAQRIVNLIVAEEEFDPEIDGLFSLDDGIERAAAGPGFFLVAASGHSGRWRMVGGAVAGAAVSALSRGAYFPAGGEVRRGTDVDAGAPLVLIAIHGPCRLLCRQTLSCRRR